MGPITPSFSIVSDDQTSNNFGGKLENFTNIVNAVNVQLALIDTSGNFNTSTTKLYVDGSLALRDVSIAWLAAQTAGEVTKAYVDASIAVFATNASVGLTLGAFATNASVGLSESGFATNASVGSAKFIRFVPGAGTGLRDASANLYDFAIVDTSAYLKVGVSSWLQWKFTEVSLG